MGKETLSEPSRSISKQKPPKEEEMQSLTDKVKDLKIKSAKEFESFLPKELRDALNEEGKAITE
jgi:exoribonuclease R